MGRMRAAWPATPRPRRESPADEAPSHDRAVSGIRLRLCRWALALALSAALLARASAPAGAEQFQTKWVGSWYCDDRGAVTPLRGARVELWQRGIDLLPKWLTDDLIAVTYTDDSGAYEFNTVSNGEDDFYVRVLTDDNDTTRLGNWWEPWPWFTDTGTNQNDVPVQSFGDVAVKLRHFHDSGSPECAIWQGIHDAYLDFEDAMGFAAGRRAARAVQRARADPVLALHGDDVAALLRRRPGRDGSGRPRGDQPDYVPRVRPHLPPRLRRWRRSLLLRRCALRLPADPQPLQGHELGLRLQRGLGRVLVGRLPPLHRREPRRFLPRYGDHEAHRRGQRGALAARPGRLLQLHAPDLRGHPDQEPGGHP